MRTNLITAAFLSLLVCTANAAWYWPFGSSEKEPPRISELIEDAVKLIDEASDLADDKKTDEAIAKYRAALAELDRVEAQNPDRVEKPEFATVRSKRAYIQSAIDSLVFEQTRQNARAVTVTDTTELEKKYMKLKGIAAPAAEEAPAPKPGKPAEKAVVADTRRAEIAEMLKKDPKSRRARLLLAALDLKEGDLSAAMLSAEDLVAEKPGDEAALNLKAAIEMKKGAFKAAENTLDSCIMSNPRGYAAYYNMAKLYLATRGASSKDAARRIYETGRKYGGPADAALEAALK